MADSFEQQAGKMHDALSLTSEQVRQVLEDATVHIVCAPEDRDQVQQYLDGLPNHGLHQLRTSVFVEQGRMLAWQRDGILAPATPAVIRLGE